MAVSWRRFKLTEILRVRGVPVYVHWTVFIIVALILAGALEQPGLSFVVLFSYFAVLLIHECGHLIAAQRLGYRVLSIKLYPIFGITLLEQPWSRSDRIVIAWAGVLAQGTVALPLIAWFGLFGYTRFEAVNALIAILGPFSFGVALFNLLPVPPLDGAVAWRLIPALFEKLRTGKGRQRGSWKHR